MKDKYIIFDSAGLSPSEDIRFLFKRIPGKIRFGSRKNCIFFDSLDCIIASSMPIDIEITTILRDYAETYRSKMKYGAMALSWLSSIGIIQIFEANSDDEAKLYFELNNLNNPPNRDCFVIL